MVKENWGGFHPDYRIDATGKKTFSRWRRSRTSRITGKRKFFKFSWAGGMAESLRRAKLEWNQLVARLETEEKEHAEKSAVPAFKEDWDSAANAVLKSAQILNRTLGPDHPATQMVKEQFVLLKRADSFVDSSGHSPLNLYPPFGTPALDEQSNPLICLEKTSPQEQTQIFGAISNGGKPVAPESVTSTAIKNFLEHKRMQAETGQLSVGRYANIRKHLEFFESWYGSDSDLKEFKGQWKSFSTHLLSLSQKPKAEGGGQSMNTLKNIQATAKQFLLDAQDLGICEVVGLANRNYRISSQSKKRGYCTLNTIRNLFSIANDREELYALLSLNTGMTQKDISDLSKDELDLKKGTITRKRSKEKHQQGVPIVTWRLWGRTIELLKQEISTDPVRVLLNERGKPLLQIRLRDNENYHQKNDNIGTNMKRLCDKMSERGLLKEGEVRPLNQALRRTAAQFLQEHTRFKFFSRYFLDQAPRNVTDSNYVTPSQKEFDQAVLWLGQKLGVEGKPEPKKKTGVMARKVEIVGVSKGICNRTKGKEC